MGSLLCSFERWDFGWLCVGRDGAVDQHRIELIEAALPVTNTQVKT
jgi:hypothetical protein